METEKTKQIKETLYSYVPSKLTENIKINVARPIHNMKELCVSVDGNKSGVVDFVKIAETIEESKDGQAHSMRIICFEIKVSKEDFNNKNGHNFVGHFNYYVMPNELYKTIVDKIPENIGVVTYSVNKYGSRFKTVKHSTLKELSTEIEKWLLLSALKATSRKITRRVF